MAEHAPEKDVRTHRSGNGMSSYKERLDEYTLAAGKRQARVAVMAFICSQNVVEIRSRLDTSPLGPSNGAAVKLATATG